MTRMWLAASPVIAALFLLPGAAGAQPLKRDIHGIALGMTIGEVEALKLKNCQAGSHVSLYCNDGQYSIRLSDKRRIYQIAISPCSTYTCKDLDSNALMRQLEAEYKVRLDPSIARAYSGKRDDMTVGLSFSEDLWHIAIVDQKIQADDSLPQRAGALPPPQSPKPN